MCLCTPIHIKMRFCGAVYGHDKRRGRYPVGFGSKEMREACRHPKTGQPDQPRSVDARGAQHEYHARLEEPAVKREHHPKVVAAHLGFHFSALEDVRDKLKSVADAVGTQALTGGLREARASFATLGHDFEAIERLGQTLRAPAAAGANSGDADVVAHYGRLVAMVETGALPTLRHVAAGLAVEPPVTTHGDIARLHYRRLANMTEAALAQLREVVDWIHAPPASAGRLAPHASPANPGGVR